jgi:hypothetical protein
VVITYSKHTAEYPLCSRKNPKGHSEEYLHVTLGYAGEFPKLRVLRFGMTQKADEYHTGEYPELPTRQRLGAGMSRGE